MGAGVLLRIHLEVLDRYIGRIITLGGRSAALATKAFLRTDGACDVLSFFHALFCLSNIFQYQITLTMFYSVPLAQH